MEAKEELKAISRILLPKDTYYKKIQQDLEHKDKIKRHAQSEEEKEAYQILHDDKILGILGG